ncbi:hypothetical protein [Sedimentibacter sp. zth1]|uniref:hypothetical protein n=1 Tax=Sedimentibacter sp. zth1 TaxID=2816908 RepID=UPI001F5F650A|nr:hypothetical protein [Sedimentibacter sp. zth1]
MIDDEALHFSKSTDFIVDPKELGDEAIINTLKNIRKLGCEFDDRILDCSVSASFQCYSKLFLSKTKT